jgi:hypothetical protein
MTLLIRSWYLARAIGVTKTVPNGKYIEVKVEGGPPLFWPMQPKAMEEV